MKSAHERASNRVPRIQKQTLELDGRSVPGRSFVAAKKVILPTRSREHFHTRTAFAESFFSRGAFRDATCRTSHVVVLHTVLSRDIAHSSSIESDCTRRRNCRTGH